MMRTKSADTYMESLQHRAADFMEETGNELFTIKELGAWAIRNGHWDPPHDLVLKKCCEDFARALREESFTDPHGGTVRAKHVARVTRNEEQLYLWADIRRAPHEHIETSFDQRRKQIVGDCRQLSRDNKYYQSIHPDRPKIQIVFDFQDDVEEGEFSGEYPPKKPR